MRDRPTCQCDQACYAGSVALDASHVVYLGRAALELGGGDHAEASDLLAQMLRATACWMAGRLWTTTLIWDQVDEQVARLGLAPPAGGRWDEYVMTHNSRQVAASSSLATGGGRHDDDLLCCVADEAARHPTLLLTNDEGLFGRARRLMLGRDDGRLTTENSTWMMLRLLRCGAVAEEVVGACLVAEHRNLAEMRRGGMRDEKYDAKLRRLDRAGLEVALYKFTDDWQPDPGF